MALIINIRPLLCISAKLQLQSMGIGHQRIKGVKTGRYVAMDKSGNLYSTVRRQFFDFYQCQVNPRYLCVYIYISSYTAYIKLVKFTLQEVKRKEKLNYKLITMTLIATCRKIITRHSRHVRCSKMKSGNSVLGPTAILGFGYVK